MADFNGLKSEVSTAETQGASHQDARRAVLRRIPSREMPTYIEQVLAPNGKHCLIVVERLARDGTLTDEEAAAYVRDARAAASLQHANVVRGRAIGVRQSEILVACDFVDGERLSELWHTAQAARSTVPVDIAVRVLVDILSGLGALHSLADEDRRSLELVHGEVTAANVLVGADGVSRLLHTCRIRRPGATNQDEPSSLSPEAASGKKIDARADVFSVGVLLWQSLRGRAVGSDSDLVAKIRAGTAERASAPKGESWAAPLANVAARAMAVLPQDRYPSAAAMSAELQKIMMGKLPGHSKVAAFVQVNAGAKIEARRKMQPAQSASLPQAQPVARVKLQPDPSAQPKAAAATAKPRITLQPRTIRIAQATYQPTGPSSQSAYSVTLRPHAGAPPAPRALDKQPEAARPAPAKPLGAQPPPAPPVPKTKPANVAKGPPAAGSQPALPKARAVIDWPSETKTLRPPPAPLFGRAHPTSPRDAVTPPVSERPVRVEPKVVIAVAGMPLTPGGGIAPIVSTLDEEDLIEVESDPPSSSAAPTPRIPPPPHVPTNLTGSRATGRSHLDLPARAPVMASARLAEKPMPSIRSVSRPAAGDEQLRAQRALRARAIFVAVGAACVLIASAAGWRAWQTRHEAPAAIVAATHEPMPVERPAPAIANTTHAEPTAAHAEPAVVEPAAVEPAAEEAPPVAAPASPVDTVDPVLSPDRSAETSAPAGVAKTAASPATPPPATVSSSSPSTPPAARRPKEPATDSVPSPSPGVRPRFDPTKI